ILFLDLDGFKGINDVLGHLVGDQLLVEFSQRLSSTVRPGDTVARLGGDEFTILLDDLNDMNDALTAVKRLVKTLKEPFHLPGRSRLMNLSRWPKLPEPSCRSANGFCKKAAGRFVNGKRAVRKIRLCT